MVDGSFISLASDFISNVTNVVGVAEKNIRSAWDISDEVHYRRNLARFNKLIGGFGLLSQSQSTIPLQLIHIANEIEKQNGKVTREINEKLFSMSNTIHDVLEKIVELQEYLKEINNGSNGLKSELYRNLVLSLYAREEVWGNIRYRLKTANPEQLRELAKVYDQLIKATGKYRDQLLEHVKPLEDRQFGKGSG